MKDLSLHILDIVENSIAAGAKNIKITIDEDTKKDLLILKIQDDGKGMNKKTLSKALDPFFTTKKVRRIGLGLSMLAQATRETGGSIDIKSKKGEGACITAIFVYSHIDRKPLGDITETLISLIATRGFDIDFIYKHYKNKHGFIFDTKVIKKKLKDVPVYNTLVINYLKNNLTKEFEKLKKRSNA
ncbi:hypothetical protein A2Y85_00635 [candidate division WOR-3 bacterium RBG_13_43_14]|uniref:histidine kinase n=1 Tax=candidate division WOR-3 bacterium RBG_13_43_14 TaxID=1802590 RepID=A0A1F4U715_UNCW3|nr:MAG: hypothetical protein A2Y85_00635 [candidate division WOR-3 bacterium RBG_13_43_14]